MTLCRSGSLFSWPLWALVFQASTCVVSRFWAVISSWVRGVIAGVDCLGQHVVDVGQCVVIGGDETLDAVLTTALVLSDTVTVASSPSVVPTRE